MTAVPAKKLGADPIPPGDRPSRHRSTVDSISISVVIPTYNRKPLLGRAVESALNQTAPAHEIIVVDDGSTDDSHTYMQRHFPEIRVIRQTRKGVSSARNRGVEASGGNWIAFLDSDDAWLPHKLEQQVESMRANPDLRICHCDEIWIRRGVRVNPKVKHAKAGGWIFSRCLPRCAISPSAVVVAKSLLLEVGLFDEDLPACEDYDLWLRICARYPVLFVQQPLVVKYGGHADQLSRTVWGLDRFRIRALEKLLDSEVLTEPQRRETVATLVDKVEIFLKGAAKRGRTSDVESLRRLRSRWLERGDDRGRRSA
ncbi:MAG: glycosyltransferase family A protein [Acidobacteriota bacterium]